MSSTEPFRKAMQTDGLDYFGPIVADGKIHRFRALGDKARDSWYILHAGPPAAGVFGSWRGAVGKQTWHERNAKELTASEREAIRRCIDEAEAERKRVEKLQQRKTRRIAHWILSRSKTADSSHPYLLAKGVQPHNELHQWRRKLVLPLRDADGLLHSLQFIDAEGLKLFLAGGRVRGCMSTIVHNGTGPLVICEGYATAASVFEATSYVTIAAMNCGNLLAVAKAMRAKWPDRDIIIAADNDQFTTDNGGKPTNPGVSKATEAAKAVHARLTIPQFKTIETKPTDFNDLAQLEGNNAVKDQIEAATKPKESDEEAYQRLVKLSPAEYDRCRKAEAKRLGVRPATLDAEVTRRHVTAEGATFQGGAVELADVELWPAPVVGARVLAEVANTLSKYVVLPAGAADAIALWIAHTHSFKAFLHTPRLNIQSPEKRCGKTTLRDVLATLVPKPLPTENLSTAVLFRVVDKHQPTLLADEYDSWLPNNEDLRGMLNAGHQRGGQALRCVGDAFEPRAFRVFAPVVLAGIGGLPGTLHDRSIVIKMVRAKSGELKAGFDSRRIQAEIDLCRKLAKWCADHAKQIESTDPILPSGAFNRLADNWRPLFAIAEVGGGDWPQRAAHAFELLTMQDDADAHGIGTMLLDDVRTAFEQAGSDRLFSKVLVDSLVAMSDKPWGEIHKGKAITENWLAYRLKSFGVAPKTQRIGSDRAKGYEVGAFHEAFARYLSERPDRDTVTSPENIDANSHSQAVTSDTLVTIQQTHETADNTALSPCHACKTPAVESANDELLV